MREEDNGPFPATTIIIISSITVRSFSSYFFFPVMCAYKYWFIKVSISRKYYVWCVRVCVCDTKLYPLSNFTEIVCVLTHVNDFKEDSSLPYLLHNGKKSNWPPKKLDIALWTGAYCCLRDIAFKTHSTLRSRPLVSNTDSAFPCAQATVVTLLYAVK